MSAMSALGNGNCPVPESRLTAVDQAYLQKVAAFFAKGVRASGGGPL
jgi:hypothetical protein